MKTLSAVILLCLTVCSCSATLPPKKEPAKATQNLEQDFKAAEAFAKSGDAKKALARLKRVVQQGPETELADDAHFLMGRIYFDSHQYDIAAEHFDAIAKSPVQSPIEAEARIRHARSLLKINRIDEAAEALDRSDRWPNVSLAQAIDIEKLRFETQLGKRDHVGALQALITVINATPPSPERDRYQSVGQEIVDTRLSESELRQVASSSKFGFLQSSAQFRYGSILLEKRDYSRARRMFSEVAESAPGTEIGERAKSYVQQIESRNKVNARTIGVVLPLSGKQSGIGYKALHGIQLGLGVLGSSSQSQFRLAVMDSEGNPENARRAVERLVLEDNAIAIIGGVLSKTASAEATRAQEFGVPTIMLSQKTGITDAGDFIFRNALTSQMQIQYIVDVAMGKMGYRNFAVVFPNDPYGVEYANLFWDEVKNRGGNITGAQPYDPKETDFRGHVQRLVGTFYLEDRADEHRLRAKQWAEKNPRRSSRQAPPAIEDLLQPIVDFDAVFIPDAARPVGQIAPMFAYNNVHNIKLIGTNLWNSQAIIKRGQKFVEGSIFADSFLATDPAFVNSNFATQFKAAFNEEPGLTELQAYDSALILRQLISDGETTRTGLQERMARIRNLPGALGPLTVNANREFQRPLTALTVKGGQITGLEMIQR